MNAATPIDLSALKTRQQSAWASGDYAVVGTTLQLVGELLAEACDLRYDEKVLDVAAGNGNATLAAARRGCKVTSTDYVPELLDRGAQRARAEGLTAEFLPADAEALPFEQATFDCVLSTFGVMFAPDQTRTAAELSRVCRPGGRIGLANWSSGRFHRPALHDSGPSRAARTRHSIARALGCRVASGNIFPWLCRENRHHPAGFPVPLSLGCSFH